LSFLFQGFFLPDQPRLFLCGVRSGWGVPPSGFWQSGEEKLIERAEKGVFRAGGGDGAGFSVKAAGVFPAGKDAAFSRRIRVVGKGRAADGAAQKARRPVAA